MTTHTNARLIRAGHRQINTEDGKPFCDVLSGAVGSAEADANEERLVTAWNSHDQLVEALKLARARCFAHRPPMTLSKCTTMQKYMDDMFTIDAALIAAGVTP